MKLLPKQTSQIFSDEALKKIEEYYNAVFVGDFSLKTRDGMWANFPAAVFYQYTPPLDYDNYMALYYNQEGVLFITGASFVRDLEFDGVVADDGEIIYSSYRHDYKISTDGTAFADGGFEYLRCNRPSVKLKVVKDKIARI